MELWIRSQCKGYLFKTSHIYVANTEDIGNVCSFDPETKKPYIIGTYATKERAIEVLDEIQSILMPRLDVTVISSLNEKDKHILNKINEFDFINIEDKKSALETIINSCYVYEMPQE